MIIRTRFTLRAQLCLCGVLLLGLYGQSLTAADVDSRIGLNAVDCWFEIGSDWPPTECFHMQVPENHEANDSRIISFPVIVFRARFNFWGNAPVLHLGGGGPGSQMFLENAQSVRYIWEYHDEISTDQRRDLIVIDPRGSGLAKPLLVCHNYVDNLPGRLSRNLSMLEEWSEIDKDYKLCIDVYAARGIDFKSYNSYSIALDIEMLRQAMEIDRWVLIGVSYASIYAQMVAREFPDTVEAMVLDSATFPNLTPEENHLQETLRPMQALLNYCHSDINCKQPMVDFEMRFWNLYRELNLNPITVNLAHPYQPGHIEIVLNGERFIGAVLMGIYDVTIYQELPTIIAELEKRRYWAIRPYLESLMLFWFDRGFADLSMESHYCFDTKPHTDFEQIKSEINKMPQGYLRSMMMLTLKWGNNCEQMNITAGYPAMVESTSINIPTLFLHGEFDMVTPLVNVVSQRKYFPNSRLVKYKLAHSIISSEECAEVVAAKFIDDTSSDEADLNCN